MQNVLYSNPNTTLQISFEKNETHYLYENKNAYLSSPYRRFSSIESSSRSGCVSAIHDRIFRDKSQSEKLLSFLKKDQNIIELKILKVENKKNNFRPVSPFRIFFLITENNRVPVCTSQIKDQIIPL